ncbi:MAG: Lrp/AsnC ligand binding domain-containing protein [Rikenellaceae bacterium]|jgi:Lrp/AsnC family transcriptional regulator for asnA, asnC and gidA|nr:Lrp/AsnC ligand binding domain-containing protein [Rikenellaceae bacterium]
MAKVTIDEIDRKILRYLVENARMPFLEIARECGISGAAIHQRVKKLDEAGVILGSKIDIDPRLLGYDVCAIIGVQLKDPASNDDTIARLKEINEIVECHFIAGHYSILLKVYCRDNDHMMHTLFDKIRKIPTIYDTETFISLMEPFSRQVFIDDNL